MAATAEVAVAAEVYVAMAQQSRAATAESRGGGNIKLKPTKCYFRFPNVPCSFDKSNNS